MKYSECIGAFSNPTSFTIFSMDPLIGSAMLAIEPALVYSLIDCMFGGDGKPTQRMREFTLIEQRMMRKFALEVLDSSAAGLENYRSHKRRIEKNRNQARVCPPGFTERFNGCHCLFRKRRENFPATFIYAFHI